MEVALLKWMTLIICYMIVSINAIPSPGLLKVPKVYNALVTSDQNLQPSRAYPVIQPVIHRTSIGYVPPLYYNPVGAGPVGPQILSAPGVVTGVAPLPGTGQVVPSDPSSERENPDVEQVSVSDQTENREISIEKERPLNDEEGKDDDANRNRVPLSFYPNYQSLYYNPYFYGYNLYPPGIGAPGTYYFDYQPRGPLLPFPPQIAPSIPTAQLHADTIRSAQSNSPKSSAQREKKRKTKVDSPIM